MRNDVKDPVCLIN